jgi:hypothetical protein
MKTGAMGDLVLDQAEAGAEAEVEAVHQLREKTAAWCLLMRRMRSTCRAKTSI